MKPVDLQPVNKHTCLRLRDIQFVACLIRNQTKHSHWMKQRSNDFLFWRINFSRQNMFTRGHVSIVRAFLPVTTKKSLSLVSLIILRKYFL